MQGGVGSITYGLFKEDMLYNNKLMIDYGKLQCTLSDAAAHLQAVPEVKLCHLVLLLPEVDLAQPIPAHASPQQADIIAKIFCFLI